MIYSMFRVAVGNKLGAIMTVISIYLLADLFGTLYENREIKPEVKPVTYKYTVWVGNSFISKGYRTDEYKIDGEFLTIDYGSEQSVMIPIDSIQQIDVNHKDGHLND